MYNTDTKLVFVFLRLLKHLNYSSIMDMMCRLSAFILESLKCLGASPPQHVPPSFFLKGPWAGVGDSFVVSLLFKQIKSLQLI